MSPSKFDAIVENRAVERTRARIRQFQTDINEAVITLTKGRSRPLSNDSFWASAPWAEICAALISNKWPAYLWEQEREAVTKELLSVMDEMQKALVAPAPSEDGPMPPEEKGQP